MRTLKDWVIASRPWSFTASLIPVVAITAYLFYKHSTCGWECDWTNALLALPMLICLQAAGNLIGDYFDHKKGVDLEGSLNGVRHIQSGKFQPKEILHYGFAMLTTAALIGLIIVWRTNMLSLLIGAIGLMMAAFYPWLKYHALGDLDVLLGYALLPAIGISYVVTGIIHWEVLLLSLPFGVITVAILHANNTRDIVNDTRAGIQTFSILLGGKVSQYLYAIELGSAYVLIVVLYVLDFIPVTAFLPFLTLPLAIKLSKQMLANEPLAETPIASLDQQTAQLQMTFGLIFTAAFILAAFL